LSGADIFGRNRTYVVRYEQVNGLQNAAAVVISGVKVGQVTDVAVNLEQGGVDVNITVDSAFDIPADSRAMMFSAGLMGGKAIEIKLGEATEHLSSGAQIATGTSLDVFEMLTNELGDIKERVVKVLDNVDKTISDVDSLVGNNAQSITSALANLNSVLKDFEQSNIINNIDGFCATLNQNGAKLDSIITDVGTVTHSFSEQNLAQKLNDAVSQVSTLLNQINNGKGSLGNLVADEKLYKELAQASQNLSVLLADLKENPKRYINVTVFGGKSYDEKQAEKAAKAAKKAEKTSKK
jgi:phospholipid/cholesterol/gamma-HCH transport system substrate-binding protein